MTQVNAREDEPVNVHTRAWCEANLMATGIRNCHGRRTKLRSNFILALIAGIIFLGAPLSSAVAEKPAKLIAGTLMCSGEGSVGLIFGSQQKFDCAFAPAGNKPRQSYTAIMQRIGLDVGVKGKSQMVWLVLVSTSNLPVGALAGKYFGASADAAMAVGGGAKWLIGGLNNSISLQPWSVEGQTGVNVAVGITGLTLTHNP